MAQHITRIRTASGDLQIDYNALANLPNISEAVEDILDNKSLLQGTDSTLSQAGQAADAKAVGERIASISGGAASVELDTTLSVSGKAADAKAVGDAIANISVSGDGGGIEHLVVTLDQTNSTASHSSTEIINHLNNNGSVILKTGNGSVYLQLLGYAGAVVMFHAVQSVEDSIVQTVCAIYDDKTYFMEDRTMGQGMSEEQASQIQTNTDAIAAMQDKVVSGSLAVEPNKYTVTLTLESGNSDVIVLETDDNDYPSTMTVNGTPIDWNVTGV